LDSYSVRNFNQALRDLQKSFILEVAMLDLGCDNGNEFGMAAEQE
jgi:hypothetical protein